MESTLKLKQAVKDYQKGKAEAFTTLYEESSKYIYTCIYNVMHDNDNAQDVIADIMQETYLEVSKNIKQLENEEKFLSWAGKIANRKCYAYLKKNKKYVLLNEEDDTLDNFSDSESIIPEDVMQDKEKQRLVRKIIETQLTEMQKLCIVAYYYNEQKQSEIAQELGIPENTVKTNLSRAKAKIKEGVLDLEKKEGTKLYSVAPLLLLLFKEDVQAASVPEGISQNILSASTGTAAKGIIGKIASASLKTKIIASIVAAGVVGGTVLLWQGGQSGDNAILENAKQAESNAVVSDAVTTSASTAADAKLANPDEEVTEDNTDSTLNLEEFDYSFEDRSIMGFGTPIFTSDDFEECIIMAHLPESINLYDSCGQVIGYTKPDIDTYTRGKYGEWYEIQVGYTVRYAKISEFDAVAEVQEKEVEEDPAPTNKDPIPSQTTEISKTENTKTETSNTNNEAPAQATEGPVESDKYTPDEAVSVSRNIMESSGITWDPSIKDFASWCSGMMSLNKNECTEQANNTVRDFQAGNTVGNSYTRYYMEITGSDANYVYFNIWFCS